MRPQDIRPPRPAARPARKTRGAGSGDWGPGSANRRFAGFMVVLFALMGYAVWWNVDRVRETARAAAEAAPRMVCTFATWCVAGDCSAAPPGDFTLITRGAHRRAYLRMDGRSGDLSAFMGDGGGFVRDVAEGDGRWPRRYMHTASKRAEVNLYLSRTLDFALTYDLEETDVPDLAPASAEGRGTCAWIVEEAA